MSPWLDAGLNGATPGAAPTATDTAGFDAEIETVAWIFDEVRTGRALPVIEAEAVVGSLYLQQRALDSLRISIVAHDDIGRYHATHAVNVAMLSMVLAEQLDFDGASIRRIGLAAVVHDVGMTRVPADVVTKAGQISQHERDLVMAHPIEGARIIMATDLSMDLAATVAFEHHLKTDGSGYPRLVYPRAPHYVSRLIQLCDVFHALSSPRPFRPPWPSEIIVSYLNERAGFDFHPGLAGTLTSLITRQTSPTG